MIVRGQFQHTARWQPDWRIDDAPLVYLDLETTGLHPERGQKIVEAAVLDDGGVRLCRRASEGFDGDTELALLTNIGELLDGVVVVGHNILFDLRFIAERARRRGTPVPKTGFVDTLRVARDLVESPEGHELSSVARTLGVEVPEIIHRAVPDARLTRRVFEAITATNGLELLAEVGVQRLDLYEHRGE